MSDLNLKPQLTTGEQDLDAVRQKLRELVDVHIGNRNDKIRAAAKELSKELPEEVLHQSLKTVFEASSLYHTLRKQAQIDAILTIADRQRSQTKNITPQILDQMIISCYQPLKDKLVAKPTRPPSEDIIGVFFEDEYLSRARYPVPYIIIPGFAEGLRWAWISVAHEVGHHVYWQVPALRDELDVRVADALTKNGLDYQIQRLYFHCLEETFSDLYGLLIMGKAYLHSGQSLFLYGSISAYQAKQPPSDPAQQHQLIQNSLLTAKDTSYPPPLVRGNLALYAYQVLMESKDLIDIGEWNANIEEKIKKETLPNPHTHSPAWTKHVPELSYELVRKGMETVVDVMLTAKLSALGGSTLKDLVNFPKEETLREDMLKASQQSPLKSPGSTFQTFWDSLFGKPEEEPNRPQKADEIVNWANQNSLPINQESAWRYWIAAEYLRDHEAG